jgi:chemosensory pili system protein ChpC
MAEASYVVVHSLLLPLRAIRLAVPSAAVAELVPFGTAEPVQGGPEWLLGAIAWRGKHVLVVSFEGAQGMAGGDADWVTHLAVMNGLGGHPDLDFYAIAITDIPRLVKIDENAIAPDAEDQPGALGLMTVLVKGERALIPDLQALENRLRAVPLPEPA